MKAEIKIWVLTGDKQETAINIGKCILKFPDAGFVLFLKCLVEVPRASSKALTGDVLRPRKVYLNQMKMLLRALSAVINTETPSP